MRAQGRLGFCLLFGLSSACSLVTGVDFEEARRDDSTPENVPSASNSSGAPGSVGTFSPIEPAPPFTPRDAGMDAKVPDPPIPGIAVPCYPDGDGDGIPASTMPRVTAVTCPVGTTSRGAPLDCDDRDPNAKPGQAQFFGTPRVSGGFDYNCNNVVEWNAVNPAGEVRTNADENCNSIRSRDACENTVRVSGVDAAQCGRDLDVNVCHWFAVQCGKSLTTETMRIVCR